MSPSPGTSLQDSQEHPPASYEDTSLPPLTWHSCAVCLPSSKLMHENCGLLFALFFLLLISKLSIQYLFVLGKCAKVLGRQRCDSGGLRSKALLPVIRESLDRSGI